MTYEIVDNFLDKATFNKIKTIIESGDFPWYWNDRVTYEKSDDFSYYLTHSLYKDTVSQSSFYQQFMPLIFEKLEVKAVIRVKINLYTNVNAFIENENHTDYDYPHKGAILYLNTNNGYTILEDDTKIESIENRLLKFEPHKKHRSTNCTDAKRRLNINLNYF